MKSYSLFHNRWQGCMCFCFLFSLFAEALSKKHQYRAGGVLGHWFCLLDKMVVRSGGDSQGDGVRVGVLQAISTAWLLRRNLARSQLWCYCSRARSWCCFRDLAGWCSHSSLSIGLFELPALSWFYCFFWVSLTLARIYIARLIWAWSWEFFFLVVSIRVFRRLWHDGTSWFVRIAVMIWVLIWWYKFAGLMYLLGNDWWTRRVDWCRWVVRVAVPDSANVIDVPEAGDALFLILAIELRHL